MAADPLYTLDILRLAGSLEPPHRLDREDGRASLRSPTCGSTIETAVTLNGDGRIADLSQRVIACAFGQAGAALLATEAKGRTRDDIARAHAELRDWLAGDRADAGHWPGLDALEPARPKRGRHGAILLPFRALIAAMEQ